MSKILSERVLANSTNMWYTYDTLNRVGSRTILNAPTGTVLERFIYDEAGNITSVPCEDCFAYEPTSNRMTEWNERTLIGYDFDGNTTINGMHGCAYDSANKLISCNGHTYTYNAEDVRIRNLCDTEDTTYTYDTNCKLSRLLMKTTNGVVTKYVYGRGLIGEETNGAFKTYHFDCRGSTVAITDASGNITDTFEYDTYGGLLSRTGTSNVIFGYNGRDGVVTDANGLIYMRARYYSPAIKRFINMDVVHGNISNAITLNRYAYANGNPVLYTDPFGLAVWWENVLKIAASVAIVATLAAVSVATAGTATAVIAGAAAVGGAIGGTVGAVSGYIENGIDGAANGILVGTVSGAASGAVTASPLNAAGVVAGNVAIDVGEYMFGQAMNGESITTEGVFLAAGTSLIFGNLEIKLKKGIHLGIDLKPGWLNEAGDLYADKQLLEHIIEREARRANRDYAEKKVLNSTLRFNDILADRLWGYGIDATEDEIGSIIEAVVYQIKNEGDENQRK